MKKTIIETMREICQKLGIGDSTKDRSVLEERNMAKARKDIRDLEKKLGMNPVQVVILCALMARSSSYSVDESDLEKDLCLDHFALLQLRNEIEGLRKKRYVRISKDGSIVLPREVENTLCSNNVIEEESIAGLSTMEIFTRMNEYLNMLENEAISAVEFETQIEELLKANPSTSVAQACTKVFKKVTDVYERLVFVVYLQRQAILNCQYTEWSDLIDYLPRSAMIKLASLARNGELELQKQAIVEYAGEGGFLNTDYFKIRTPILQESLEDSGGYKPKAVTIGGALRIDWNTLSSKELFYSEDVSRRIARLSSQLADTKFTEICERLRTSGYRSGFTILFYGAPGTGKTETVYQLARKSHRDIFIVNVAQIRSSYVGESEKNIQAVFERYRQICSQGGVTPILLFNEADAIFGVRREGGVEAVDKMENSIQNIILQQMETFDGILIATTNLTSSLDEAFKRRFFEKVFFDRPSADIRSKIWREMIPELSVDESIRLAEDYDFSGGQIENITRKMTVESIVSGVKSSFNDIVRFCKEENVVNGFMQRKIGF